jgi:SAM-dependent methyltransferase
MLRSLLRRLAGSDPTHRNSLLAPGNLLIVQDRERWLARFLAKNTRSTENLRVFEAGCGGGYNLRQLVQWGCRPERLCGMDLDGVGIDYLRSRSPEIRAYKGSADQVPEPDASFDLSLAFTLFSSVRDEETAAAIAAELYRLTRPGGAILVYDMRRSNPYNEDIRPVVTDDIRRWFPRCTIEKRSITLAPPLARSVARFAPWLYGPLAAIPPLRSHMMFVLRRPGATPRFLRQPLETRE